MSCCVIYQIHLHLGKTPILRSYLNQVGVRLSSVGRECYVREDIYKCIPVNVFELKPHPFPTNQLQSQTLAYAKLILKDTSLLIALPSTKSNILYNVNNAVAAIVSPQTFAINAISTKRDVIVCTSE